MRKLIATILFLSLGAFAFCGVTPPEYPLDIQLKTLYAAPSAKSKEIFSIPIEVRILDVSKDLNWYQVKISFKLGPFEQTYIGWTNIPFDELLLSE